MTFLHPILLWGLPLVLLPVIIHLINRMRHRTQPWAAMRFLVAATRSSVGHAKLRQFLILLFRVLAVLMLIVFLARPLAGGWLGWALSPAPDAILILLDRSASMETLVPGTTSTRREQALNLLSRAAKEFEETSHLILLESAFRTPQEITHGANLLDLSAVSATDTAADIPAMFQAAINWLIENRAGTAEIWIASDLQRTNWRPEDARWNNMVAQLSALPQKVKVRLLSFSPESQNNTSVSLKEVVRRPGPQQSQLNFVLDLARNSASTEPLPLALNLDGARSQIGLVMDGQTMRWRYKADLGKKEGGGWGSFELPADGNARDNTSYFVYGNEVALKAGIISSDNEAGRFLRLAASTIIKGELEPAQTVSPARFQDLPLEGRTLLIWQSLLPVGPAAERIRAFADEGGVVIFFPPGQAGSEAFSGISWSEVQASTPAKEFHVMRWDENDGPLAKTDEGFSLPLGKVSFKRRQLTAGPKNILAAFDDGVPFLSRQTVGKGEILFCASLPHSDWSSLEEGPVLVPMIQRLLQAGNKRVQQAASIACGELSPSEQSRQWKSIDSTTAKDIRLQSGVYRSGERTLAVNRPAAEDEPDVLPAEDAQRLFARLPFQMFMEKQNQSDRLQGEIWRMFLFAMILFLMAEGYLILPPRPLIAQPGTRSGRASAPNPAAAAMAK